VNERLTKARCKVLSALSINEVDGRVNCSPSEIYLLMRLMEERIAHPEKYIDEGNPTPPEVNIYHSVFSDNVVVASFVVNST